ncbi:MAG: hypothetical protein AAF628_13035 [Planctomycetota bacterium]
MMRSRPNRFSSPPAIRLATPAWAVLALIGLTPVLDAQVLVVDAAGGPGAQFTDLPAAVAAAPAGATLVVRPGLYSQFVLAGKGLTILGDAGGPVRVARFGFASEVRDVPAGATVILQNLTFQGFSLSASGLSLAITDTRGSVVLDDVQNEPGTVAPFRLGIANAADVQLHRCRFTGAREHLGIGARIDAFDSSVLLSDSTITGIRAAQSLASGVDGGTGLRATRSRVVLWRSTIRGGDGGPCCFRSGALASTTQGRGGIGAEVRDGAELAVLRSTVRGGDGRDAFDSIFGGPTVAASAGGVGLQVGAGSTARVEGLPPLGGNGGAGAPAGQGLVTMAGGAATVDSDSFPPAAELIGTPAAGRTVTFDLEARPGSLGALLLSAQTSVAPFEPRALGSILSGIAAVVPTPPVPATGRLGINAVVVGPVGARLSAQFATVDPAPARLWLSNPFVVLIVP